MSIPFSSLADLSTRLAGRSSRLDKKALLVAFLADVPEEERVSAIGWLSGRVPGGPLGIGPVRLHELMATQERGSARSTLAEVDAALERSRVEKSDRAVAELFESLTKEERQFLGGALMGSLRQGSAEGIMILALAEMASLDEAVVRRAVMVRGSVARAAAAILSGGSESAPNRLELLQPVAPMLASSASSVEEALTGAVARVDWKIDGVRAQIHKRGDEVRIFSRQGNDLTRGLASIASRVSALGADTLVLDGEVVLEEANDARRTRPFQETFSAIASASIPAGYDLALYVFDCLHENGADLLDLPLRERLDRLARVAGDLLVKGIETASAVEAKAFDEEGRARGHEGIMIKDLSSPYRAGARGAAWRKVKAFHTVDLVVLAVEEGSGRRRGYLSNLHLGALHEDGSFCMVGKTFKGLTDAMLGFQTKRLRELAIGDSKRGVLRVKLELVVEIRFNDVQRSPRYPGGIALRFARIVRYREDKSPAEIEPLASLVALLPKGGPETPASSPRVAREKRASRQLSLFPDERSRRSRGES